MSTPEAASATFAIVLLALGLLAIGLCRAAARADRAAEAHRPRVWDNTVGQWVHLPPGVQPGPGQLTVREVEDADPLELLLEAPAYDRAAAAVDGGLTNLFEQLGPPPVYDPALEPHEERLWDAIRDTNTAEGEQLS